MLHTQQEKNRKQKINKMQSGATQAMSGENAFEKWAKVSPHTFLQQNILEH